MTFLRSFPILLIAFFLGCSAEDDIPSDTAELFDKAVTLFNDKSYRQSEVLFAQALVVFERRGAQATMAEIAGYMGRIGLELGEFRSAIDQLENGIKFAKQANDYREEMKLRSYLGHVYQEMGEYEDAIRSYRTVHALAVAFNDGETVAQTDHDIATTLFYDGKYERAKESCESALSYYRSSSNAEKLGAALWLLGEIHVRQVRYAEALNILNQAESVAERSSDPLLVPKIKLSIGRMYRINGNSSVALQYFRDATNVLRSKKGRREYEAVFLFEIANVYYDAGQYENAKRFYTEAATIARALGDRISENFLYLYVVRCKEKLSRIDQTPANAERVARDYRQLAPRFAELLHRSGEAIAYAKAGMLYETAGMYTTAREMYLKATSLFEERDGEYRVPDLHDAYVREIGIQQDDVYERLAAILVQLRAPGEALALLEKAQTSTYQAQLRGSEFDVRHPQLKDDVAQMRKLLRDVRQMEVELSGLLAFRQRASASQRINELRAKLGKGKSDIPKLAAKIVALYPNYEPLTKGGATKLVEVQSHVPRGTVVVRFLSTDERLVIFALSRTRFEVKVSPIQKRQLSGLMEEYKRLLQDPRVYAGSAGEASVPVMTRFAQLSSQLYDHLIRPIEPLIERNLVLVADKMFEGFPIHALERQEPNGVKYLIEMTSVDYLPSLSCLKYKTASSLRIRDIVAVGNPIGKNWSIDYELRDIRSFFKEANILIGMEASWEKISRLRGDVLQLSTEFVQDENEWPWGSVVLADGQTPEKEEMLSFRSLAGMNTFPVIYLSNQIGPGTGLTSIHALLLRMNGTSDVFFNAWSADRKAAKFFSEFFFTYLSHGLAPGDAYRQALLNLIKTREVNHPRSWAQFFHYGVG